MNWPENPNPLPPSLWATTPPPKRSEDEQQFDLIAAWLVTRFPVLSQRCNNDPLVTILQLSEIIKSYADQETEPEISFTSEDYEFMRAIEQAFKGQKEVDGR